MEKDGETILNIGTGNKTVNSFGMNQSQAMASRNLFLCVSLCVCDYINTNTLGYTPEATNTPSMYSDYVLNEAKMNQKE